MMLNKVRILPFLLLIAFHGNAQTAYEKADSIALNFAESFETVQELGQKLTSSLSTNEEKARVLFMWIADNVRYDCRKYHNRTPHRITAYSQEELQQKVNAWNEEQALNTAKKKKGICGDYSQLYASLCKETGLEARIITGNSRNLYKPFRNSKGNDHAWNAVKIDDQWKLVDATWAAGHADRKVTKFTKKIAPGYFFTPPSWFAQDHQPTDENWQLLEKPISKKEFTDRPMINYGQHEYKILDFSSSVKQSAGKKNSNEIWIQFENVPKEFIITTRGRKHIKFHKEIVDNKVLLSFSRSHNKVSVYGGKSRRGKLNWIAIY